MLLICKLGYSWRAYPATAIIFVGSSLSLVFGVLNLIVAVVGSLAFREERGKTCGAEEVVDTFADARDRDILNLAEEMESLGWSRV